MPPSAEPTSDNSEDYDHSTVTPEMVSKRRNGGTTNSSHPPLLPKSPNTTTTNTLPTAAISFVAGRRRRLFAYLAAFATMLALSSMLDLRRAALTAKRHDRITLQPPPGPPTTSIDEENAQPADGAAIAQDAEIVQRHQQQQQQQQQHLHPMPPQPPPLVPNHEHSTVGHSNDPHASGLHTHDTSGLTNTNTADSTTPDRKLSDQELADDVDQLISHVEQEKMVANTSIPQHANDTSTVSNSTSATTLKHINGTSDTTSTGNTASPIPGTTTNATLTAETVEEQFAAAQIAMDKAAANETLKPFLDPQEARTLKALALQGARGDCEKAGDASSGSLFKTDAEAASGDIEKTDALWGAWCVFSGRYRSDAMRDYVGRTRVLRAKLEAKALAGTPIVVAEPEAFDETAATLDDVLSPDEQAALRTKAEKVVPLLRESDARLLAALALQATLGDCSLYATTDRTKKRDDEDATPPRELVEPLFGKKAVRGEGTLWGAWCVFARRKRAAAVATLKDRIEQFYKQLAAN